MKFEQCLGSSLKPKLHLGYRSSQRIRHVTPLSYIRLITRAIRLSFIFYFEFSEMMFKSEIETVS